MELRLMLGLLVASVFVSGAIYADRKGQAKKAGRKAPEIPYVEIWPVPAIPIKTMATVLTVFCVLGITTLAAGSPQPAVADNPQYVVMNTFLGFFWIGIACLLPAGIKVARWIPCVVGCWAIAGLVDSLHPFGFGNALFSHPVEFADDGRMAPFVAIGLLLSAVAAGLYRSSKRSMGRQYLIGWIGVLMSLYGFFAIIGYLAESRVMLGLDGWRPVPVGAAMILGLVGTGFASKVYQHPTDAWTQKELRTTINALIVVAAVSAFSSLVFAIMSKPSDGDGELRVLLAISLLLSGTSTLGLMSIRRVLLVKSSCHAPGCPQYLTSESLELRSAREA